MQTNRHGLLGIRESLNQSDTVYILRTDYQVAGERADHEFDDGEIVFYCEPGIFNERGFDSVSAGSYRNHLSGARGSCTIINKSPHEILDGEIENSRAAEANVLAVGDTRSDGDKYTIWEDGLTDTGIQPGKYPAHLG